MRWGTVILQKTYLAHTVRWGTVVPVCTWDTTYTNYMCDASTRCNIAVTEYKESLYTTSNKGSVHL